MKKAGKGFKFGAKPDGKGKKAMPPVKAGKSSRQKRMAKMEAKDGPV